MPSQLEIGRGADSNVGASGLTLCVLISLLFWPGSGVRTMGAESTDAKTRPARSSHWSLQPLKLPVVPAVKHSKLNSSNPIDAFIATRLATNHFLLSPAADRATLIRRLSFDLLGLPPTPAEIDAFVADKSPNAYEQLVERFLASPRYGERWARHWLDVVRYTESQGFEYDKLRDNAWHYRDYVIRSFNEDKPYDRFMKEQIAGDVLAPDTSEGIIATSLLVCGAWDEAGNSQANAVQKAITREEEMEDMLSVVGQTFLGLTINCARCHAHKFDPIPQEDYYRVKAVFEGVKHGERPIGPADEVRKHEEVATRRKKEIADAEKRIAQIEAEAKEKAGASTNLTTEQREEREKLRAQIKRADDTLKALKPLPVSYAGTRVQPPPTKRLKRGDVSSPQEIVAPAALSAVVDLNSDFGLPPDAPESQRRLKFAEWLADPRNPLPARVMANRVWHFHFGQGLVTTPSDFGVSGARPSHPELLDWLAIKFIESGWSVKALHRLILNSATYRQSSQFNPKAAVIDADDQFLWRFPPRRLEAEAVRDAMLVASGQLNLRMAGPSFRPFNALKFPANAYVPMDKVGAEFSRRTVYRMNVNSGKEPLLDAFDCPDPSVKTPRRGITTTPLQALALMNNSFVLRQAAQLADRAVNQSDGDLSGAVRFAYRQTLGRSPTRNELQRALNAVRERGLSSVCWALLNSTEFIYVR